MPEATGYVILGRGRWARKLHPIISGAGRSVVAIEETRQLPSETESDYIGRLAAAMKSSGAQIAWLCVAPGRHVSLMIRSAIDTRSRRRDTRFPHGSSCEAVSRMPAGPAWIVWPSRRPRLRR